MLLLAVIAVIAVFALAAVRWGVDSRFSNR